MIFVLVYLLAAIDTYKRVYTCILHTANIACTVAVFQVSRLWVNPPC